MCDFWTYIFLNFCKCFRRYHLYFPNLIKIRHTKIFNTYFALKIIWPKNIVHLTIDGILCFGSYSFIFCLYFSTFSTWYLRDFKIPFYYSPKMRYCFIIESTEFSFLPLFSLEQFWQAKVIIITDYFLLHSKNGNPTKWRKNKFKMIINQVKKRYMEVK